MGGTMRSLLATSGRIAPAGQEGHIHAHLLGATEIQHRPGAEGAGHIIGTPRMGTDPKTSVVDRDLRSHDHPNLFILGSALFPTSAQPIPH